LVLAVAEGQNGLLSRPQALAEGISDDALAHRVRSGRWQRVLPGVYATFSGPVAEAIRERAALLYAGEGALLHEVTSCRRHGVKYLTEDDRVHVLVPHGVQKTSRDFVVVHRTHLLPARLVVGGLPCSPVARAAVDLCRGQSSMRTARAVLCDAVQRGRTTVEALAEVLEHGHSAGSALPRRAVADLMAGCRSAPECELRDLVVTSRVLPEPEWNVAVHDRRGRLLGRPDGWWREIRLALEVNSREHHLFGPDWEATMRRQSAFAADGVLVLPISPQRIRYEPEPLLSEIESAYLGRLAMIEVA
jgi:hypothetical protein